MIPSVFRFKKIMSGRRLMKNAELTAILAISASLEFCWLGVSVVSSGYIRIKKIRRRDECIINVIFSFHLDLHQEFLVPKTNG